MSKQLDRAWFAGLYEGEGTAYFRPEPRCDGSRGGRGGVPTLRITSTDEDVIRTAAAIAGCGAVYGPYDRGAGRKPSFQWSASKRNDVLRLAKWLLPFLKSRRAAQLRKALDG